MRVLSFLLKHTSSLRSCSMSCRFEDTCATWGVRLSFGADLCAGGDRSPRHVQDTRCDSDKMTSPCDTALPVTELRGQVCVGEVDGDTAVCVDDGSGIDDVIHMLLIDDDTPLGGTVFFTSVMKQIKPFN